MSTVTVIVTEQEAGDVQACVIIERRITGEQTAPLSLVRHEMEWHLQAHKGAVEWLRTYADLQAMYGETLQSVTLRGVADKIQTARWR